MATITIKKRKVALPSQKKRTPSRIRLVVLNLYGVMLMVITGIMVTCFLYLDEFNDIATQGVIINSLEGDRNKLIIENEVWNMRIAQLKSLDVIEQQSVVNRMPTIDPAEIEFINLDQMPKDENELE